ncbi:MAG: hypothetical protein ACHQF3_06030 [Alphaproteobacteria bacterium]
MTAGLLMGGLGALWFLLLAILLSLSGLGLLTLLGCRGRLGAPLFLAPALMLALWTILCSGAAWLRLPIVGATPWVWAATLLLMLPGIRVVVRTVQGRESSAPSGFAPGIGAGFLVPAVLCCLLPLAVVPGVLRFGLADFAGSTAPDSWSYVAVADYLRVETRGIAAGLSPLHQYAAHLAEARNATYALLAFLSSAAPGGRPDTAVNLFCLLSLLAFAAAVAHFALTVFERRRAPTVALLLLSVYGWPGEIISVGNFDQLLVLPLFPALASLAAHVAKERSPWRLAPAAAILIAAAFYTYVEMAIVSIAVAASFSLAGGIRPWRAFGRAAAAALLALAGAGVALLPAGKALVVFFLDQLAVGTTTVPRPAEGYFPGLSDPAYALSAVWALGGEFHFPENFLPGTLVAAAMTGCALWGATRRGRGVLPALAGGVVVVLYGVMAFGSHYAYGAYKIVSVNFWVIAWLAVSGGSDLARRLGRKLAFQNLGSAEGYGLALLLVPAIYLRAHTVLEISHFEASAAAPRLAREAADAVRRIGKGAPLLLSVSADIANEWAVYQLSAVPMRVVPYRLYMSAPHLAPFMAAARTVPWDTIAYVLTDRSRPAVPATVAGGRVVWQNGTYALWQVAPGHWTTIAEVGNPNGAETDGERPFIWLGGGATRLTVVSGAAGDAILTAEVVPGPRAAAEVHSWDLAVGTGAWRTTAEIGTPAASIRLPLKAGETDVELAVLAAPAERLPGNGDRRPLIVGLFGYRLTSIGD